MGRLAGLLEAVGSAVRTTDCSDDTHGCCCEHAVDTLIAAPVTDEQRLEMAKNKFTDCPHVRGVSPLETLIDQLRRPTPWH